MTFHFHPIDLIKQIQLQSFSLHFLTTTTATTNICCDVNAYTKTHMHFVRNRKVPCQWLWGWFLGPFNAPGRLFGTLDVNHTPCQGTFNVILQLSWTLGLNGNVCCCFYRFIAWDTCSSAISTL